MAKPDHIFTCQACGAIWPKWTGKCDACGEWNTLVEEAARPVVPGAFAAPIGKKSKALAFVELDRRKPNRRRGSPQASPNLTASAAAAWCPRRAILIGGDPGVGKSTLLLQVAAALAQERRSVAYVTGEEAEAQVQERARRLKAGDAPVQLAAETDLRKILEGLKALKPDVVVVDSIQTRLGRWRRSGARHGRASARVRARTGALRQEERLRSSSWSGTSRRTAKSPARAWSSTSSTP